MDSSQQSWLSFSLSNQPTNDSSNLCLFEAFTSNHGTVERLENDSGGDGGLSMLCMGPKLEDFLGGGNATVGRFGVAATESDAGGIYDDSELKTIAAGFLRGLTADGVKGAVVAEAAGGKKGADSFGQRTSIYRGVTRHRWTGRYEAHLWDNSCRREGQSRKGRQGGYDKEEKAARAYDLAALKYWGPTTTTNFPISNYEKELEEMKDMTRQEFVASLRRKSSGFSRGASIYRGVTRHHQHGRWQARIGRVAGNKDLYLGTFSTQEEAAEAYDIAAIKFRGLNAVTNFDMSRYDVKSIASSNLPIGGISGKSRPSDSSSSDNKSSESKQTDLSMASQPSTLTFSQPIKSDPQDYWSLLALQNPSQSHAKNKPTLIQSSPNSSNLHCLSNYNNNVDFSTCPTINQGNGSFLNGGIFQQQNPCVTVAAPGPATTVAESGYDSSSYGTWATTSIHSFQPAKPSLTVLQTPIFGME
ncbi:AP2-like protein ethylene-responsive transcription factor AIL5 [Cinnamomum micranthum f. kanehirae]|uniref:AP2-like protein ethylene-responsive transcription factor AIL5 n=1 Tax=Cinnamomum micranthum f. kanehirae TaxID=337451 RepID=A0A3S3NAK0_9MAGN|nr:AP2-like protein ethylene-responsive transcription factor AIL5 [Cinnamomum micranthum f. kanehirae]